MKIRSVFDKEFSAYGQILHGYNIQPLTDALVSATPLPSEVEYVASEPALEALEVMQALQDNAYGGMPIQLGWCNGHNTKLNCLEYHRDSELNLGATDFILLLGKQEDICDHMLDTATVEAFFCPANTLIEVYATTLHYAPCSAKNGEGFRVMVALPRGTNTKKPQIEPRNQEDARLWARNKWLLAHAKSTEAADGCPVGLIGENIDIASLL